MIRVESRDEYLLELKKHLPKECVGAEIGVFEGVFARNIIKILNPKRLFLIDPYVTNEDKYGFGFGELTTAYSNDDMYQELIRKFERELMFGTVIILKKYSYEVVSSFEDKSLDFIYLDGSHKYNDVKKDLNDWLPKLKDGGICAGHDYFLMEGFGVVQAVNEFKKENNFEMFLLNDNGGDWALRSNTFEDYILRTKAKQGVWFGINPKVV